MNHIDEQGFLVLDQTKTIKAKYQGYCMKCWHSYWQGEQVNKEGKGFSHLDCLRALADRTPRKIDPKKEAELKAAGLGIPSKKILKTKAKKRLFKEGPGVNAGG